WNWGGARASSSRCRSPLAPRRGWRKGQAPEARMDAPERERIVVVDDDLLLAEALQIAWERENDLSIVGVAITGAEGVELACQTHRDVVPMDHNPPDMKGT